MATPAAGTDGAGAATPVEGSSDQVPAVPAGVLKDLHGYLAIEVPVMVNWGCGG